MHVMCLLCKTELLAQKIDAHLEECVFKMLHELPVHVKTSVVLRAARELPARERALLAKLYCPSCGYCAPEHAGVCEVRELTTLLGAAS